MAKKKSTLPSLADSYLLAKLFILEITYFTKITTLFSVWYESNSICKTFYCNHYTVVTYNVTARQLPLAGIKFLYNMQNFNQNSATNTNGN